jgi:hypothetical protein
MTPIGLNANQNLRPRVLSNGERRGLSSYYAFTHGIHPSWWRDEAVSKASGDIIGVLENEDGPADALVITEQELIVLAPSGPWSVRYDQVKKFEPPGLHGKDPVPDHIVAFMYSGETVRVPVRYPLGVAFDFYRFLLYAVTQSKKCKAVE